MAVKLLSHLILESASRSPDADAVRFKQQTLSYAQLASRMVNTASGLQNAGLKHGERVAIYLPKCFENVLACFATGIAGGIFVPINPILKPHQVLHILKDCAASILITSSNRLAALCDELTQRAELHTIITIDGEVTSTLQSALPGRKFISWQALESEPATCMHPSVDETDVASILYTSGSTGLPSGVVLSHKNMVCGAISVAEYLKNSSSDRILVLLPFSFDYGFNQLTTALYSGACAVLMDYLLPYDVIRTIADEKITGLAAVPTLWVKLTKLAWPQDASKSLRYITNSGGVMPKHTLDALHGTFPHASIYMMYGLTEAFRSTYLPPEQIDYRPNSVGKAIPNAQILVVRKDGTTCKPGEPGELVHCGPLVAMGYWNNPLKTAQKFKPAPPGAQQFPAPDIAVWSGDIVTTDADGYIYFIGREDDMIKTSGYRVSPTEVEDVISQSGFVDEVVCVGLHHAELGQTIVAAVTAANASTELDIELIHAYCRKWLPPYMLPSKIIQYDYFPLNPNGKIDRSRLSIDISLNHGYKETEYV